MKISPKTKQIVAGTSLVLLAAVNIPVLEGIIPDNIVGYVKYISYAGLFGAYWIFKSETA